MDILTADDDVTSAIAEVAVNFTLGITSKILTTLCGEDEGCYRRAAERASTASPTMLPQFSTTPLSQRLNCTEYQARKISCLNGGTCFASPGLEDQPILGCSCTGFRMGRRCESEFIPSFPVTQDHIRTAKLAGSITVVVLISFAIILGLYVWFRIRKPTRSSQATNGDARLLENGQQTSEKTQPQHGGDPKALDVHNGNWKPSVEQTDETVPLKSMCPATEGSKSAELQAQQSTPDSS